MPFSRKFEQSVLDSWFGNTAPTIPGTYYVGLILQLGALSSTLTAGASFTSLPCAASGGGAVAAYSGANGDTILIGSGPNTQVVSASALWTSSATSISVNSFIADQTFAAGTPFVRCDVYATAQEPSGGSYARVPVVNNTTNLPAATLSGDSYQKQNGVDISFPQCTVDWGKVAGWLVGDNITPGSGSLFAYGALGSAQLISAGNTPSFSVDQITITLL